MTKQSAEPLYEVVWPLGKVTTSAVPLAPGLSDLNGKTICEVWDWVFRGDQMYSVLNEQLRKKYPDIKIIDHETMGNSHALGEREWVANLPELLRKHGADAVISATGA